MLKLRESCNFRRIKPFFPLRKTGTAHECEGKVPPLLDESLACTSGGKGARPLQFPQTSDFILINVNINVAKKVNKNIVLINRLVNVDLSAKTKNTFFRDIEEK